MIISCNTLFINKTADYNRIIHYSLIVSNNQNFSICYVCHVIRLIWCFPHWLQSNVHQTSIGKGQLRDKSEEQSSLIVSHQRARKFIACGNTEFCSGVVAPRNGKRFSLSNLVSPVMRWSEVVYAVVANVEIACALGIYFAERENVTRVIFRNLR